MEGRLSEVYRLIGSLVDLTYCISVKRHGMIDFTLRMYSVYMRDGIKYYKYEEVNTWTVWVWIGIEMGCRGIMILDFISMKRHQIMCFT